ncbi:TolC family protein [Flavobacterium sp. J372]|uniref:TolC family protein n=1 Tax=Flavobacterium sp. J372 TaxID=2898436 RepID=UPI00215195A5|nr:TolC family protein [Flavobacterium sp. J372]MCR5862776.1 TolC family protein [Flavobacterium sp. J372]
MRPIIYIILFIFCIQGAAAQELSPGQLSFAEYLGYVKKYHPLTRQSNLTISRAEAELMAARGGFDPKIEVDYDKKEFKGTEYYSLLNSSFKIPTWYGIEIKAAFDNSEGIYVNPQNITPDGGLTSVGISVPLAQGLLVNRRMTDLRMAKVQIRLSAAEQKLQATEAIYNAALAYFSWKRAFEEVRLYETYLDYAQVRYTGITKLIQLGDKPAIDSVEAGIVVKSRQLNLADARLKLTKARLEMSNYLWIDNVPVELAENIVPEENLTQNVTELLNITNATASLQLEQHPKVQALQGKIDILEIDRRYKANLLLPKVDVSYNYLSEPSYFDNYRFEDYKIGLNFSFPLFLRKERGMLKLAKLKLQDGQLDLDLERVALKNKITAQQAEIEALQSQQITVSALVKDYTTMLSSEERLFSFGESSLFIINSRENNVVSSRLSEINIENRLLNSMAELYRTLSNP